MLCFPQFWEAFCSTPYAKESLTIDGNRQLPLEVPIVSRITSRTNISLRGLLTVACCAAIGCSGNPTSPSAASAKTVPAPISPIGALLAPSPTLVSSEEWPTFAHDMLRSSVQPGSSQITTGTVATLQPLWIFRSPAPYDLAAPIVDNGIVYTADLTGHVTALNARSGQVIWQRSFGVGIKLTPSSYDGHIFVGTLDGSTPSARSTLMALDPRTGATQWQASIDGGLHGSPVAISGRLFVPVTLGDPGYCHPGGVYLFDEKTGNSGVSWLTGGSVASDGGAVWSPLSYDGARIYFGTGNTCVDTPQTSNAVVALDTSTALAWSFQTSSPVTDDDVGGGVLQSGGTAYVTGKNGNIYALDPASGNLRWQRALGSPDEDGSYSTPAVAAGTLITSVGFKVDPSGQVPAGTQFGALLGLDPSSGSQRWEVDAISPFFSPPAIVDNMAFTTVDEQAVALDAASGRLLWSSPIEAPSRTQPVVAEDQLFVADSNGNLFAFGIPTSGNPASRERMAFRSKAAQHRWQNPFRFIPAFCRLRQPSRS